MAVRGTIQMPLECDFDSDLAVVLPLVNDQTAITCLETNRDYRKQGGAWVQKRPDPAVVQMLNDADTNLQNQITTISTNLNGLTLDNIVEGVTNKYYTATEKAKLAGIATGATANQSDAYLLNRTNHTGTQLAATISDFVAAIRSALSNTTPARSLNTAFQISTTKWSIVTYAVDVSISSLLLGSAQGSGYLEYADDSGFTTNVVLQSQGTNSTSGVLNIVNKGTVLLHGLIPPGKYVRIRTVQDAGTATFALQSRAESVI